MPVWGTLIALAARRHAARRRGQLPRARHAAGGRRPAAAPGRRTRPAPSRGRIRVSGVSDLEHASLSFQSIAQWDEAGYLDRLVALTRRVWRDRAYGDMWSYMLLAEGLLDAVGEFGVKTYDLAALIPIVEEAGGTFTSVDGTPGPGNGSSLASNGAHPRGPARGARLSRADGPSRTAHLRP